MAVANNRLRYNMKFRIKKIEFIIEFKLKKARLNCIIYTGNNLEFFKYLCTVSIVFFL